MVISVEQLNLPPEVIVVFGELLDPGLQESDMLFISFILLDSWTLVVDAGDLVNLQLLDLGLELLVLLSNLRLVF